MAVVSTALAAFLALMFRVEPEPEEPPVEPFCRWLAGDLDVHSAYTFVSARNEPLEDALTYSPSVEEQADLAFERGLDFLAITDYNDISAQSDPAYGSDGLIWIPAYEHPFAATAQLLGTTELVPVGAVSAREVHRIADSLRRQGGILQVGHPGDGRWPLVYGTRIRPDALEVWLAGPWSYDPGRVGKNQTRAVRFYDRLLDSGHQVAATGGSNSLFRGITKLAGAGQPTTWACAREATSDAVLEAIAAGRTTLAHEFPTQAPLTEGDSGAGAPVPDSPAGDEGFAVPPPNTANPFVSIEADADGDGEFESLMGDSVPSGAAIRIGVFGGPFSVLRVVSDGSTVLDQTDVFTPTFVHEMVFPDDSTWIRAELFARPEDTVGGVCEVEGRTATYCDDRIGMLAFTSPLYVDDEFGGDR